MSFGDCSHRETKNSSCCLTKILQIFYSTLENLDAIDLVSIEGIGSKTATQLNNIYKRKTYL